MCDTVTKYYQQAISMKALQNFFQFLIDDKILQLFFAKTIAIFCHQLKMFRFFKVKLELMVPISIIVNFLQL